MRIIYLEKLSVLNIPEVLISVLAFFLNFFWEVLHTNYFTLKTSAYTTMLPCWLFCAGADVLITVGAFWVVSLICRSRRWFLSANRLRFILFVVAGVAYTVFSELAHVHILRSWAYNELMPVIPWAEVGLTPILQWMTIPSIVILTARQYFILAETVILADINSRARIGGIKK